MADPIRVIHNPEPGKKKPDLRSVGSPTLKRAERCFQRLEKVNQLLGSERSWLSFMAINQKSAVNDN